MAQNISGRLFYNQIPVKSALIINLKTDQKTLTNDKGEFIIPANTNDKIRITKEGFEIIEFRSSEDSSSKDYILKPIPTEIEEVKITYLPTGNLKKDSEYYGASLRERRVNTGLRKYFKKPSDLSVLQPKPGEFIQPVGSGFSFGKIDDKWALSDFVMWLHAELSDEYFAEFEISPNDIDRFIYFSLSSFNQKEKQNILKYGYCSNFNIGQLKLLFEKTILNFKKNDSK
ncbi:hypothetical protein G6R40_06595 [Chryseobacterium sp. POL2]|uniref:hypothetical protein n=1 Tax=Chryseobacterium sp. POL2 TaxID=2713414 RepID=UPI0013E17F7C|nr:hypothetical protein [Chryseobacterium sp. POL2]QIG89368.1 hypothetical protein G6R40_06595 [Chryseobacterium sp. POL2]